MGAATAGKEASPGSVGGITLACALSYCSRTNRLLRSSWLEVASTAPSVRSDCALSASALEMEDAIIGSPATPLVARSSNCLRFITVFFSLCRPCRQRIPPLELQKRIAHLERRRDVG